MKILIITSRVPNPLDKGDKLRIFHQIKHLSKNHEVLLCALNSSGKKADTRNLKALCNVEVLELNRFKILFNLFFGLFSKKPFQIKYFYQAPVHSRVKTIINEFNPDHIYCQLIRCAEYVKDYHDISKTLDYMDALSKGMERREEKVNFWIKPFIKSEYKRLLRYENIIFDYFENKTIISDQDREYIFHKNRKEIHVIPNGVDVEYFRPQPQADKKYDLVFVGNLNYPPNIEACKFIANDILPLLSNTTKILFSGATPAKVVLALQSDNIEVKSWVDDIRESYSSGKIFVAPMFIGTGLQNKLLEAMAMNIPCITTSLVNNALRANKGSEVILAESGTSFAEAINELLQDNSKNDDLAKSGCSFVRKNYSWDTFNQKLEDIIVSSV